MTAFFSLWPSMYSLYAVTQTLYHKVLLGKPGKAYNEEASTRFLKCADSHMDCLVCYVNHPTGVLERIVCIVSMEGNNVNNRTY